jgi:uncharacterized protein
MSPTPNNTMRHTMHHTTRLLAFLLGLLAAAHTGAQTPPPNPAPNPGQPTLSAPVPPNRNKPGGAGYHSPQSRFEPLKERKGVVPWSLLSAVTIRAEGNRLVPVFPAGVQALRQTTITVEGFMMPLDPGKQRRFLLSAVPTTCSFCTPAGPEGLVDVHGQEAIGFTENAILMRGKLQLMVDDKFGLYYRLTEARLVKQP